MRVRGSDDGSGCAFIFLGFLIVILVHSCSKLDEIHREMKELRWEFQQVHHIEPKVEEVKP